MDFTAKLVPIIEKISKYRYPGKKALQKLIYLIERKGVELEFDFSIHYYGPYSSRLSNAIQSLQMQGIIDIKNNGKTQEIHLNKEISSIFGGEDLSKAELKMVENVLDIFGRMKAFELELITTTDFVAQQLKTAAADDIARSVKRIKRDKFSECEIFNAISLLKENGYLPN